MTKEDEREEKEREFQKYYEENSSWGQLAKVRRELFEELVKTLKINQILKWFSGKLK